MANIICVGAQWGDEGKGKVIDVLTEGSDVVVRSQGGNNAGHTVIDGKKKYVLHLVPSGILHKGKVCVISNGVVIDPVALVGEIDGLRKQKIAVGRNLIISDRAHLVLPYHRALDGVLETAKGKGKIGTTKRGIGPAYADKIERVGFRMCDLLKPERFAKRLRARISGANRILKDAGEKPIPFQKTLEETLEAAKVLTPLIRNTTIYLHEAMREKREILFEGAQGTYLDVDHGTYPFVTSSNTTSGGACTGSGVAPHRMDKVLGVVKAYTTRVGEGPFPTEDDTFGDYLHGLGREFGATTGRSRRCGWFDAVSTRYAAIINGMDEIAVTNIDGLDETDTIRICTAYKLDGKTIHAPPADSEDLERCQPVYEEMPGWKKTTTDCRTFKDLPPKARNYLKKLAKLTGTKLAMVSVGPKREETITI